MKKKIIQTSIHKLFEEQTKRTPHNIAVEFEEKYITYEELNSLSNYIANNILKSVTNLPQPIGIMSDSYIEIIICMLSIWKSGNLFLLLDPKYPVNKCQYISDTSEIDFILTKKKYKEKIKQFSMKDNNHLYIDNLFEIEYKSGITFIDNNSINQNQAAYIIFSSGSTGIPKGILISHKNILNSIYWRIENYKLSINNICLVYNIYYLDHIIDIFSILLTGGKIVCIDDIHCVSNIIFEKKITNMTTIPLYFADVLSSKEKFINFNFLILIGDQIPNQSFIDLFYKKCPNANLYFEFLYPETGIISSKRIITVDNKNLGKPINNVEIFILDEELKMLETNTIGQLAIAGEGVTTGYINKEKLNIESFHQIYDKRLFLTGDMARVLEDDTIIFSGRKSTQIKIRGFRIELAETEKIIVSFSNVNAAIVLIKKTDDDQKILCAYIAVEPDFSINQLKSYLVEHLPEYMIPTKYILLEELPLLPNGKINKKALPEPLNFNKDEVQISTPWNNIELTLLSIIRNILRIERINKNDILFNIGLNSITSILLINAIKKTFNVELPIIFLFKNNTIKAIGDFINEQKGR